MEEIVKTDAYQRIVIRGLVGSLALFGAGFVIGFMASKLVGWIGDTAESTEVTDRIDAVVTARENLEERVASQSARIDELETELVAARQALDAVEEETPDEPQPDPFEERMLARMERRIEGRVGAMTARYGLDAAQQEALRDVFRNRMEHFRAVRRGEAEGTFNLDEAIGEVLTEEQFAAYLEESQQEIYNRAELMATGAVVRMAQVMELAPEVEDVVYETVHLTAQEMMIARQAGEAYDMRGTLDERLSTVLTGEQMEALRESGTGMGPGFGGGMGRGGMGPPP